MRLEGEGSHGWLAMSRNVSTTGVLAATAKILAVGQPVAVNFTVAPGMEPLRVQGTIVRVELNVEDKSGLWPHRVAVEFDEEVPELEMLVEADTANGAMDYLVKLEKGEP
jgi:hypothetical protein